MIKRRHSDPWWKEVRTKPERKWIVDKRITNDGGGMNGGIYLVRDAKTDKEYIEKRAKREDISSGFTVQEILILKFLSCPPHPNITPIVDHFVDTRNKKASIYLERANRGSLMDFIDARRESDKVLFNELDVWEWFIMLFDAMSYCHFGPHQGEEAEKDWNKTASRHQVRQHTGH
ncbi:hypothetical protein CC80DRAFT_232580 [Byssothecium circinans]|uniref:Protein kinase domain-containing protein n=1 Tax=Byssothecium circinans TaxID=147558 RepID=A0A6A5U954_9PLEO|nr:hypothetical protein CC80DRAFT_232580 [Byssothecium circinans]